MLRTALRPHSLRLAAMAGLLAACGSDPTGPTPGTPATIARVELRNAPAEVTVGQTVQLQAVALDADDAILAGRAITWSSSATDVARVETDGRLVAVAAGTAQITAATGGKQAQTTIRVIAAPVAAPASVEIQQGASAALRIGGSMALTAVIRDAEGRVLDGRAATWRTTADQIVDVSATGVTTALAAGQALVIAAAGLVEDTVRVVVETDVRRVEIMVSDELVLLVGDQIQLQARAYDADGIALNTPISWWSTDPSVLEVTATGRVRALKAGAAVIVASSQGVQGNALVGVLGATRFTAIEANGQALPTTFVTMPITGGTARYEMMAGTFRLSTDGRYEQGFDFQIFVTGQPMQLGSIARGGTVSRDLATGEFVFTPDDPAQPAFRGVRTEAGELRVTQRYLTGAAESTVLYRVQR